MSKHINKKYTISMRKHLINHSIDLINSDIGMTKFHHNRLNNEALFIMGADVLFDCDSPPDMKGSFQEQKIAAAWRYRREDSVRLALKMKLFESVRYPTSLYDSNYYLSEYKITRLGAIFRRMPAFFQSALIMVFVAAIRISEAATRFKWVTGLVSFAVLAIKVWHSGLINNWWIAFSAAIGLAVGLLATLRG